VAVLSALLALFVAGTAKGAGAYGEEPPTQKLFYKGERVQVTKDHTYSWHYYWSEGGQSGCTSGVHFQDPG